MFPARAGMSRAMAAPLHGPGLMFPARAGMSRKNQMSITAIADVPRASGDEPPEKVLYQLPNGCSPRERG